MVIKEKKGIAIALSGGSVRGLAHIGFLEVMEKYHIPIDHIVGTSMGALIGGIYASGKLNEFKEEILKLSDNKALIFLLTHKIRNGKGDTEDLTKILKKFVDKKKIENLNIGFTAVATDLNTGKEVFLEEGNLIKSINASICIPGIFSPVKRGKMLLVDGGVTDPLPQDYAFKIAKKVITVNAMPTKFSYKKDGETFDIISESVSILIGQLIGRRIKRKKNLLFIQLKTHGIDSFDFKNAAKVIDVGRRAAEDHINQIIEFTSD